MMKRILMSVMLLLCLIGTSVSAGPRIDEAVLSQISNTQPLAILCNPKNTSTTTVYFTDDDDRTIFWFAEQAGAISYNYNYVDGVSLTQAINETKDNGGCIVSLSSDLHKTLLPFGFQVMYVPIQGNMKTYFTVANFYLSPSSIAGVTIQLKNKQF